MHKTAEIGFEVSAREASGEGELSQACCNRLEHCSGVDQSLISRLELAKAPHASLERIVRLSKALGDFFPIGTCPTDA